MALYVEQLSDLPAKFLAEAIDEWIKTQVFWPAVSELRDLCNRKARATRAEIKEIQERAERKRQAEADARIDRPTKAQIEEIKQRIGSLYQTTRAT